MVETEIELNLEQVLQEYFGFNSFKGQQKEIIEHILDGNDTLVIMPTGGGKSLCYQLPALMSEGTAIVISPLIALMKNQVDMVRGYARNDSIAHFMNSSLKAADLKNVKSDLIEGKTKLLYVAPETLNKENTIAFLKSLKISFIAVDEAHCISEWGHDFRPDYRNIKEAIRQIEQNIPIVALTATATPKVRLDMAKTLQLNKPKLFIDSFNRSNLYYEIRAKKDKDKTIKNIVQFVKSNPGKSGIVYCLNRKTTEQMAETLQMNGVKAAAYHAGLDAATRNNVQDMFLMEDVDVITATIAFGMGIDKPDVRFVIHFDIPKSIENYYQETGRAGRDGLDGHCIAYFSHADINKMDKFLKDKPVKEKEIGGQHLMEMVAFSESGACRRQFILHYFGELFPADKCEKGCDNCRNPLPSQNAKNQLVMALKAINELDGQFELKHLVDFIVGSRTKMIVTYRHDGHKQFAVGKAESKIYWNSLLRKALLENYLAKEIEEYGLISVSEKGLDFIKNPTDFELSLNRDFENLDNSIVTNTTQSVALDDNLLKLLKDLRKREAKRRNLPPFVLFQDTSLSEMATSYPINTDELQHIGGVSKGKAIKFGRAFVSLIAEYVEENNIDRPLEIVTKQMANKSKAKISIIQNIDKKVPLQTIADSLKISLEDLFQEIEAIAASGTKLNLDYFINEYLDEDQQEEIYEYFMEAETDDLQVALEEIDDEDYTLDDMRMMKIKFMSEVAH